MQQAFHVLQSAMEIIQDNNKRFKGLEVKFSSMEEYFQEIEKMRLSVYKGDFFPYQETSNTGPKYWTGFYSSRPVLKKKISESHRMARALEIALTLSVKEDYEFPQSSLVLHHDAITGTCNPQVKDDYLERLENEQSKNLSTFQSLFNILFKADSHPLSAPFKVFLVYNSLNWSVQRLVSLKSDFKFVLIKDWNFDTVTSQSVPSGEEFTIYFKLTLPPLSISTVFMREFPSPCHDCSYVSTESSALKASDDLYTVYFTEEYLIDNITTQDGKIWHMKQDFWRYSDEEGGYYMFCPSDEGLPIPDLSPSAFTVYSGPVVTIAISVWDRTKYYYPEYDKYYQTVILSNFSRFSVKVGVFAMENEDIFLRFTNPNIKGDSWFYTGNSGDLRVRNWKKTKPYMQGKNMYPVPGGFSVQSNNNGFLYVFPQFAIGVGMTSQQSFELLLHRRPENDDGANLDMEPKDRSFVEHTFELEIGDLTDKAYFKAFFEVKNSPLVFPVEIVNQKIQMAGQYHLALQNWTFVTGFSFGIDDEEAYLSSAVIRENKYVFRVFNFDSELLWENYKLEENVLFGGFSKIQEKHFNRDTFGIESKTGYVPENFTGFNFSTYIASRISPEDLILPKEQLNERKEIKSNERLNISRKNENWSNIGKIEYLLILVLSVSFLIYIFKRMRSRKTNVD